MIDEGLKRFITIAELVGQAVRQEWLIAIDELLSEAESWCRTRSWSVRRESVRCEEELLGEFDAPYLLIHLVEGRVLLKPTARFAARTEGIAELCVLPSFDSRKLFRSRGKWHLQSDEARGQDIPWNEMTFEATIPQLASYG